MAAPGLNASPTDGELIPVNILLVDDEPANLTALEAVLTELVPTPNLVRAQSGPEALRHLLDEDFALILMDVHMPIMDGFETASLVRNRERSRNTPIIFLTAAIRGDAQIAQGYSLGAVDYILKPFDPDILRSKVSVFVELFRKTKQIELQAREREKLIEEQAARAAAEAAKQRFAFLASASETLAYSLDADVTLENLARLCVPSLADVCIVDLVDEDRDCLTRTAVSHAGEALEAAVGCVRQAPPDLVQSAHTGIAQVIRTGEPVLMHWRSGSSPMPGSLVLANEQEAACMQGLAPAAALMVPLASRDRVLGALTLVMVQQGASRPTYSEEDLTFAADLARRAALAVENARLYGEAHAAVRVRDEFLASATHDLKTPLTVIKAQAQLLHRRASKASSDDAQRVRAEASRISVAATKMVGLVDQMLDVAALQMGKPLELRRRPTDLVALCRDTVADLTDPRGQHTLRLEAKQRKVVGNWDASRIERVLHNLLSNAMKYSPQGGEVLVHVRCEEEHGERGSKPWAVLQVTDQGLGIPAEDLPRVFERFYRARNVVGKIAGTGIGLAGVRQIVEEHAGQIVVDSKEGKGTTVTIRLPLDEAAAVREDEQPSAA